MRLEGLRDWPVHLPAGACLFPAAELRDSNLGAVCTALDWLAFDDLLVDSPPARASS